MARMPIIRRRRSRYRKRPWRPWLVVIVTAALLALVAHWLVTQRPGGSSLPWLGPSEPLSDRRAQADGDEGPHERR